MIIMWKYHSPIGTMSISKNSSDRYILQYGETEIGSWNTPKQAADDVYCHETGIPEWDSLAGKVKNVPPDLSEWENY